MTRHPHILCAFYDHEIHQCCFRVCMQGRRCCVSICVKCTVSDIGPGKCSRYSDWLPARWSRDRIKVGAKSSAPVQTGAGAHPASRAVGTESFPGVKRPGRGIDHRPPSKRRVERKCRAIPLLTLWDFMACYRVSWTHRLWYRRFMDVGLCGMWCMWTVHFIVGSA